jgi:hypothetical protein
MGYAVKKAVSKKRTWKLLIEKRRADNHEKKDYINIPTEQLGMHGFHPGMTIEEAKAKASDLNRSAELKRYAEKKAKASQRVEERRLATRLAVPEEGEFFKWAEKEHRLDFERTKVMSHWLCAKDCIADLDLSPPDFFDSRRRIYSWFLCEGDESGPYSLSYCTKVMRFINLYGSYYARKFKVYFERIPFPTGRDKQELADAYYEMFGATDSAPLSPEMLDAQQANFKPEQWNWLYLSLWLGLRPQEVDRLSNPKFTQLLTEKDGTPVVKVFQTKLKNIDRERRWKYIPLLFPEQLRALELLKQGAFERPLVKTVKRYFTQQHTTYAGRKGFEELMIDVKEQPFEYVSQWLGHQSLEQTYKRYTNRTKARYKKAA